MSDKNSISITAPPPQRPSLDPDAELKALQIYREKLQIQVAEQQLALNSEAIEAKENKKSEGQALRKSQVANLKTAKVTREHTQAGCGHLKENGKTAVGGQRDSKRISHWICQGCLKEWTGDEPQVTHADGKSGLPYYLRPAAEKVGGPDY